MHALLCGHRGYESLNSLSARSPQRIRALARAGVSQILRCMTPLDGTRRALSPAWRLAWRSFIYFQDELRLAHRSAHFVCRPGTRQSARSLCHCQQALAIHALQPVRQALRAQFRLRNQLGSVLLRQEARIAGLVVIHCMREGHQHAGHPGRSKFRHRQCTRSGRSPHRLPRSVPPYHR